MSDLYCVFGNPVTHSLSPQIHAAFAAQTGQNLRYEKRQAPVDGFNTALDALLAEGGQGCNITVPFKQEAFQRCDQLTERAQRAQAVNTIVVQDNGQLLGDTTDGVGLVSDLLHEQFLRLQGSRILLLGAGGAVRGVIEPILARHPECLHIANRTSAKAEALASDFAQFGAISGGGFAEIDTSQPWDIIINGTAASLGGDVPPIPIQAVDRHTGCYDMMYSAQATAFQQWGAQLGAERCLDGLGMLVAQAAHAFAAWRGVMPEITPVLSQLRAQLQQP